MRAPADRPQARSLGREPMELHICRVGGVTAWRPDELDGGPVEREGDDPRGGADRRQRPEWALEGALIGAEEPKIAFDEQRLDPGAVGAFGQPEAAWDPEAPPVGAKPGVDLESAGGGRGDQRKHRVGRSGGQQRDVVVAGRGPKRAQHVTVEELQAVEDATVAPRLGFGRRPKLGRSPAGVSLGRLEPVAAKKHPHALSDVGSLQLIGQDRAHGDRQVPGVLKHRQVGARDRVEQPLLAERVGSESLHVRHV